MAADVQPQLDWERPRRPRVAAAALAAALLPVVASIANAAVYNQAPRASLLASLERALAEGPVAQLPSLHVPLYEFYQDKVAVLMGISLVNAAGLAATGYVLTFLGAATRARRPEFKPWAIQLAGIAAGVVAVAGPLLVIATYLAIGSLLDGPRTVAAVSEGQGGIVTAAQALEGFARVLLGAGFVLVSMNAMRAGLLTRFMGILGVIAGALLVIPIGGPLPVVQAFWLAAVAISIGDRWPGAVPPAWRTGRAEPWPSRQQQREEREAQAEEREGTQREGAPERAAASGETAAVPARSARSGAARRKRKGRG